MDAVRVAVDAPSGGLECQPGLARSARTDEREQATAGVLQQPLDRLELRRPPHERRSWYREVLHARLDRLQEREGAGKPWNLELVDPLRGAQILEAVHAEIADRRVDERTGRLGQEHLPNVADRGDPGTFVNVDNDVPLLCQPGCAGMQPHANANRAAGKCALAVRSSGDRARCACESNEERIALGVDLNASVVGERRAEPTPM